MRILSGGEVEQRSRGAIECYVHTVPGWFLWRIDGACVAVMHRRLSCQLLLSCRFANPDTVLGEHIFIGRLDVVRPNYAGTVC